MNLLAHHVHSGRHVVLEPLRRDHVDGLAAAASGDRSSFGYTQVPDGPDGASPTVGSSAAPATSIRRGRSGAAICTDARNERSRQAIERIGARFEAILHRHRRSFHPNDGDRLRDTAVYAVTVDDWPAVRDHLGSLLAR